MYKYNYEEAVKRDVKDYIFNENLYPHTSYEAEQLTELLGDELWAVDTITGNGGDFYADSETCRDMLRGNEELYAEAARELGCENLNDYCLNPQAADCTVRCYLLGTAVYKAVNELLEMFTKGLAEVNLYADEEGELHVMEKEEEG